MWLHLKASEPEMTNEQAAARIGISKYTLKGYITQAGKEGWLKFEDPRERLEWEIIPKVVRNLNEFIDKRDKTVTIETAKGTIFRQFQQDHGINEGGSNIIALRIEAPPTPEGAGTDGTTIKVVTGRIVGRPKELGS